MFEEIDDNFKYWNKVKGTEASIPFSKVCIFDGGNTFFAYLKKVVKTSGGYELEWHIAGLPDGYGTCEPIYWFKIEHPSQYNVI